jgi:hypothetical protein
VHRVAMLKAAILTLTNKHLLVFDLVSPEFVGSLALFEQKFGRNHRVGNVNYFLYAAGAVQNLAGGVNGCP